MKIKGLLKRALAFGLALWACAAVAMQNHTQVTFTGADEYDDEISEYQESLDELQEKQEELDSMIAETQDDIAYEQENQEAITAQIAVVEDTLQKLDAYIADLQDQIDQQQAQIDETDLQISQKKQEITDGVDRFKIRLRTMYIAGNESYTELLLGSTDFYDLLMKLELVKRVTEHDNAFINNLIDLKKQYEAQLELQQSQKVQLEDTMAVQEEKKSDWTAQVQKLNELYTQSKASEEALKAAEQEYYNSKDDLESEQQEAEDALQAAIEAARIAREQAEQEQNNNSGGEYSGEIREGTGNFIWPVPGYYTITSGYGYRWGTLHKGIDISGSDVHGKAIVAADAGTVIDAYSGCTHDYGKDGSCGCGGGYGNYVMIDHGNGYVTLYGHAAYISVSVGDVVEQGQTIAGVGSTGWSTGNHLHFEVRYNGTPIDPAQFFSWAS